MQWWCKPGNCKPFCQKSLGRVCKKEISEFSVDFLIRDKNLVLWPINNYSQVGGFLQWSVTCIVTSVLISFDDTYSFANSELCHLNILTDSGFWVNSQPLLYQLALWRVFSWFQWNLRPFAFGAQCLSLLPGCFLSWSYLGHRRICSKMRESMRRRLNIGLDLWHPDLIML